MSKVESTPGELRQHAHLGRSIAGDFSFGSIRGREFERTLYPENSYPLSSDSSARGNVDADVPAAPGNRPRRGSGPVNTLAIHLFDPAAAASYSAWNKMMDRELLRCEEEDS